MIISSFISKRNILFSLFIAVSSSLASAVHIYVSPDVKGSAAAIAGLTNGDLIQGVNGRAVSNIDELFKVPSSIKSKPLKLKKVRSQKTVSGQIVRTELAGENSSTVTKSTPTGKNIGAIWFIGDSITQSNADGDAKSSPRKSLYHLLKKKGYSFSFTGHHTSNVDGLPASGTKPAENLYHYHSGVSGIRIGEVNGDKGFATNMAKAWSVGRLASVKPDIILVMLGTNDVDNMQPAPARLKKLVAAIYDLPNVGNPTIFLASVPPNRRKEADRTNVMIFNESVPKIVDAYRAEGKKIFFVDQFTPINEAYKENMRGDNLHPNTTGNVTMAKQWFDAIENSLNPEAAEAATPARFPGKRSDFRGYDRYDNIKTAKGQFSIICPKNPAPGNPWLWRSLFWEAIKKVSNADLKLVEEGYYVVLAHGDVAGHPRGNANIDAAYELVTTKYGFAKKCSMASMSRGNLSLFRWATENPEKVESIYVDNGVCDVLSWPAGKLVEGNASTGSGDLRSWEGFKKTFGYTTDAEALKTKESPINLLAPLAKAGVPILMVCGNKDHAVPYDENDAIMEKRYNALGGKITVIVEDKGHSHGMKDPTPVLEFIRKNRAASMK